MPGPGTSALDAARRVSIKLASEHASRPTSMQSAERNVEEQQAEFRRRRQETITEELLDIMTGFEASR